MAALFLWPVTLVATLTSPGVGDIEVAWLIVAAALCWPGLALLGAGLAPATLGSRIDAAVAGLALGLGAPVAAVASIMIGVVFVALYPGSSGVGEAVGIAIRLGVLGAVRVAPLLVLAAVSWVVLIRRLAAEPRPAA